jgi:hypothetical protein
MSTISLVTGGIGREVCRQLAKRVATDMGGPGGFFRDGRPVPW